MVCKAISEKNAAPETLAISLNDPRNQFDYLMSAFEHVKGNTALTVPINRRGIHMHNHHIYSKEEKRDVCVYTLY
jgi:hypothetical protein